MANEKPMRPKARPTQKGAVTRSLRPKERPNNDEDFQIGDVEYQADLMEFMSKDPLARLGFDPSIVRYGENKYTRENAAYFPNEDIVAYGPDLGSSKGVILHEFRHRGLRTLKGIVDDNPEAFNHLLGDDFTETFNKKMRDEEWLTEQFDHLDEEFITPSGQTRDLEYTMSRANPSSVRRSQKDLERGDDKRFPRIHPHEVGLRQILDASEQVLHDRGVPPTAKAEEPGLFDWVPGFNEGGAVMANEKPVDPVSGNEIPLGSTAKEVRDDIPANLSEGEYVIPADVVKYYGVAHFEKLIGKAKTGYEEMEANGRMGDKTPEPPVEPEDDLPFSDEELMHSEGMYAGGTVVKPQPDNSAMGFAEGGYANGGFNPADFPTGFSTFGQGLPTGGPETRMYIDALGNRRSVMFINGQPIQQIPAGFVEDTPDNRASFETAVADTVKEQEVQTGNEGPTRDTSGTERIDLDWGSMTPDERRSEVKRGRAVTGLVGGIAGTALGPVGALVGKGARKIMDTEFAKEMRADGLSDDEISSVLGISSDEPTGGILSGLFDRITKPKETVKPTQQPTLSDGPSTGPRMVGPIMDIGQETDFEGQKTAGETQTKGSFSGSKEDDGGYKNFNEGGLVSPKKIMKKRKKPITKKKRKGLMPKA